MPENYTVLAYGNLAVSGQMYAPPAGASAVVKEVTIVPVTSGGSFRLNVVGKPLVPPISLNTGEWAEWQGSLALGTGMPLYLTNVTNPTGGFDWIVSGVEITP